MTGDRSEFVVAADPDDVFETLSQLDLVALCIPGARLVARSGDHCQGVLKLRFGPVVAAYEGEMSLAELDRVSRSARLIAAGRELGGQGTAEVKISAHVHPDRDGSRVAVTTDLVARGPAAQPGAGAIRQAAQRLIRQFAANLETLLLDAEIVGAATTPVSAGAASEDGGRALLRARAVRSALLRMAPVLVGFLVGLSVGRLALRGRHR